MSRIKKERRMIIPLPLKQQIYKEYHGICAHCGRKLYEGGNYTVDHIIPLSKGGQTTPANLAPLCFSCNRTKSDDIIDPKTYYVYADKKQKTQMEQLFQRYIDRIDCLSKNNLFQTDRFHIRSHAVVIRNKKKTQKRTAILPTTIQVQKIKPIEIIRYLNRYQEKLSELVKPIIFDTEESIDVPFYTIANNNKTVAIFSAYIDTIKDLDTIILDFFISPDVKEKPNTTAPTFYMFVNSIIKEIQKTLIWGNQGGSIDIMIRIPHSDTIGEHLIQTFLNQAPENWCELSVERKDENGENYTIINAIHGKLFAGDYTMLIQDIKKHQCKYGYELMQYYENEGINENSVRKRLEKNADTPAYHRPKPVTN